MKKNKNRIFLISYKYNLIYLDKLKEMVKIESINELKQICRNDSFKYKKRRFFIEANLSIYITNLIIKTKITPNTITITFWIIGIISGILFTSQNLLYITAAYILYRLHILLDIVDGEEKYG